MKFTKNYIQLFIFIIIIFTAFITFFAINFINFNISLISRYSYIPSKNKTIKRKLIIDVDVSNRNGRFGPPTFMRGIYHVLPYNTSNCIFIPHERITPYNSDNKSDFIHLPFPNFNEHTYNKWAKSPYLKN